MADRLPIADSSASQAMWKLVRARAGKLPGDAYSAALVTRTRKFLSAIGRENSCGNPARQWRWPPCQRTIK